MELLIVVVVLAILAAITIATYNGIQQRTRNAAIVHGAKQATTAIKAYLITNNGTYPYTGAGNVCITSTSGCIRDTGGVDGAVAAFDTNMATVATLPKTVSGSGTLGYGIMYNYLSTRTYNGVVTPAIVFYYLEGINQNCGVTGVMSAWDTAVTSATGYTSGNASSTGKTLCFVSVPGI